MTTEQRTSSGTRRPNNVAGTWRVRSATAEHDGTTSHPYGEQPAGLLVFGADLHFVEVLQRPDVPPFESGDRTDGTPAETAAAVAGALGQYGTYTVDDAGDFAANTIVGSTFPNWNGLSRGTDRLSFTRDHDELTEHLHDPDGPVITIVYQRVS